MNSIHDLQRLQEIIVRHRLPKEQTLFMEVGEYNKTMNFLKNLGSSGVQQATLKEANPELECVRINYGGIVFNIIQY